MKDWHIFLGFVFAVGIITFLLYGSGEVAGSWIARSALIGGIALIGYRLFKRRKQRNESKQAL